MLRFDAAINKKLVPAALALRALGRLKFDGNAMPLSKVRDPLEQACADQACVSTPLLSQVCDALGNTLEPVADSDGMEEQASLDAAVTPSPPAMLHVTPSPTRATQEAL